MKKIMSILIIILFLIGIGVYLINKGIIVDLNKETEIIPSEEISAQQMRQTIVTLYFFNVETGNLEPEARLIDIKDLIDLPYETILKLLMEDPKNENLKSLFPENVEINKIYADGDLIVIDFTEKFLEYDLNNKENLVNSIVKSLTELVEVNRVKILINNEINENFNEEYTR